jgi:hypothetical protein
MLFIYSGRVCEIFRKEREKIVDEVHVENWRKCSSLAATGTANP